MKRTSNTSGNPLESNSVFISFLVLGALTIMLWQAHLATGEQSLGLLAFLIGMLATAVLICLFVLLALRCHASPKSTKVLAALVYTLQEDPDPRVRSKAAVGLTQLDLERSFGHHEHNKLDDYLIHALQDPDPRVRSKAAVGLAELELEQEKPSYHREHNKLDDMLFKDGL
jgi:non-SMC mitotic condensation complex subunit 1